MATVPFASATFSVTAVDDTVLDGTQTANVTASATGFLDSSRSLNVTDYESISVTINSTSISENGGTATGTITRSNTDIGSALTVSLASSDTSEASVPATVTIPANQASATFTITAVDDSLLDGTQTATITAGATGYVSGTRTINVTDFETLTMSIGLAAVSEKGGTATGTVTRSNTNNSAALTVTLTSSDTSEASVPATVVIPAGQSSATFAVTGVDDTLLDGTQTATITASANGYAGESDDISVTDFEMLSLTVNSTSISENGGTATGTVTRGNTDVSAALTVTLDSSDTSEATTPATVTIPANQASATFPITAMEDALLDGTQTSNISVNAAGYVGASRTISITDFETITLAINPTSISEHGGVATGTVTRSNTGDGTALVVTLSSNDITEATVPTTVTIPAGQASQTFIVTGVDDALGDGTQHVVVTASAAGFSNTVAGLDVTDDEVSLVLSLSNDLLSEHGGTVIGTVSRNSPNTSLPLIVTVLSSDTTAATVPPTVTIPAGQVSVDFMITGVDDAISDGVQPATITTAASGFLSDARTVLVADDERPYQNPRNAVDIDGDLSVVPKDSLAIINILNSIGSGPAATIMAQYHGTPIFPDSNGDNFISPIDVLLVVNKLNAPPNGQGEGEAAVAQASFSAGSAAATSFLSPMLVDAVHAQTTAVTSPTSLLMAVGSILKMNPDAQPDDLPKSLLTLPARGHSKKSDPLDELFANFSFQKDDLEWAGK